MRRRITLMFALLSLAFVGVSFAQETGGEMTGGGMTGGGVAPGNVREGFVQVDDGARIYYQVQGEGEPMLLVHGYPLNGGLFRENVQALAEQYRVITVDLRGYGRSEAPNDQAVIPVYATDVLSVMEELGVEQAIIGGMSMGGPTILEMYQRAPERFTGMILIDTIAASASPAEKGLWRGVADMAQGMGVESLVPFLMKDMLSGDARMKRPELVEYLGNLMTQASLDAALGGANALATRPDYTELLPQIEVPTLILVGLEDTIYPYEISRDMQEAIPGSELAIVPGVAHAAIIEGAQAANQAILEWAQGIQ